MVSTDDATATAAVHSQRIGESSLPFPIPALIQLMLRSASDWYTTAVGTPSSFFLRDRITFGTQQWEWLQEYLNVERSLEPMLRVNQRLEDLLKAQRLNFKEQMDSLQQEREVLETQRKKYHESHSAEARPVIRAHEDASLKKMVCKKLRDLLIVKQDDVLRTMFKDEVKHYAYQSRYIHTLSTALSTLGWKLRGGGDANENAKTSFPQVFGSIHHALKDMGLARDVRDMIEPLETLTIPTQEGNSPPISGFHELLFAIPKHVLEWTPQDRQSSGAGNDGETNKKQSSGWSVIASIWLDKVRDFLLISNPLGVGSGGDSDEALPCASIVRALKGNDVLIAYHECIERFESNSLFRQELDKCPQDEQDEFHRWVDALSTVAAVDQSMRFLNALAITERCAMLNFVADMINHTRPKEETASST